MSQPESFDPPSDDNSPRGDWRDGAADCATCGEPVHPDHEVGCRCGAVTHEDERCEREHREQHMRGLDDDGPECPTCGAAADEHHYRGCTS